MDRSRLLPAVFSFVLLASATAASGARLKTTTMTMPAAAVAPAPVPAVGAAMEALSEWLEGEGSQQCWEALMEIKSCTGEIILFFLNGEAYLGPGCCRAIRVIEQRCWAADAMLSVIGFTPEEGDMLKGYCDAGDDDGGSGQGQQHGSSPPPYRAEDVGDVAAARESVGSARGRMQGPVHR